MTANRIPEITRTLLAAPDRVATTAEMFGYAFP
jgi:hypothetical protein